MIAKAFLLLLLWLTLGVAGEVAQEINTLSQKIPYASKSETKKILHLLENLYIRAVISSKKPDIRQSLKGIIRCQNLLHLDSKTYQKELLALGPLTQKKTQHKSQPSPKKASKKSHQKVPNIRYIQSKDDHIILKFNRALEEDELSFFKIKTPEGFKNIYDVKANLNFKTPPLHIPNLQKIVVAQNRNNKVRIVLQDKDMIYSKAFIRKGALFIKVNARQKSYVTKHTRPNITPKKIKPQVITPAKRISQIKSKKKKKHHKSTTKPTIVHQKPVPKNTQAVYASSKIIVIDAGHGGHDSGAVGYKRYQEKKTVYKVAKILKSLLIAKGYKIYMTRSADKFIKLKNRTHFANQKHADLFISIHANAAPKGKFLSLKGIETFFLSPAKTAKAKRIAAKENAAASGMNKKSQDTLLSFLNRNKIIQSNKLAIDVQSAMLSTTRKKFKGVKDGGVREAPFYVLVGAQMPAVLVELGYITNPTEGERLFNPFYQKSLAKGIYNGINNYFSHNK